MTAATIKLIEAVERLNMTGEIGDGTVARLHELAGLARLEQVEIGEAIAMTIAAIKPHVERAERFNAATGEVVRGVILGRGETPVNLPTSGSVVGKKCPHPVADVYRVPGFFSRVRCGKCGLESDGKGMAASAG